MIEITADDLLHFLRSQDIKSFEENILIFCNENKIMDFIGKCDNKEISLVVDWCKKCNIYIIHKIFEQLEDVKSTGFLKTLPYYDKFDSENRTLLHVAIIYDRTMEIIRFLVEDECINIESEDEYGYTPLHYYCQKDEYDVEVLRLLMKNPRQLTKRSKDGLTALEFACSDYVKLQKIRNLKNVDIKGSLKNIDDSSLGITDLRRYTLTKTFSTNRIWLNLLQKDDKYLLLSYIKYDEDFHSKYFLKPDDIISIIRKCPGNGQGILSFIKARFFKVTKEPNLCNILSDLTGIKIIERESPLTFYKSALFLALLTGRFQLISPLLRCSQFEIVPYAMLVCLICKYFITRNDFPDQVINDIVTLKDSCEQFAMAVTNCTYNKDLSQNKMVIGTYNNQPTEKLDQKSILEVAFHADCFKYLSLPTCQESLTQLWIQRNYKCPQIKFWLHSVTHILFLMLFSYVVVNNLFESIGAMEVVCYVYGIGYFVEEVCQIYQCIVKKQDSLWSYAVEATNIIDWSALFFMLLGFILRVSLYNPISTETGDYKLFMESKSVNLFVQRLILCLSLISYFMRVLYFASINETLGPNLKMISMMITKDLIPLLFVFFLFVISFGIAFQSLLFPNGFYSPSKTLGDSRTFFKKEPMTTLTDIFRRATFTTFSFDYTLDEIEASPTENLTDSYGQYAVYFLLLIFMLIVNLLLMNLLIAQFSYTVTLIILESTRLWKSGRYRFIKEYSDRTIAPPPFNIIMIFIKLLLNCMKSNQKLHLFVKTEDIETSLVTLCKEEPEDPFLSYYIYQAFAMRGQRYILSKDVNDLELEKEIQLKTMEENLKAEILDLKKAINKRFSAIESTAKSREIKTNIQ